MGMRLFGSSSSHDDSCDRNRIPLYDGPDCSTCGWKNLPNPDPSNYEIKRWKTIGKYLLMEIKYLDCVNYEGDKILLYKDVGLTQLTDQKLIDPHFSDTDMFISPVARFRPTNNGWEMAIRFMEIMEKNEHK